MSIADTDAIYFNAGGRQLVGSYYATDGEAPLALLLHGFPGSEKNHDLAHHLREKGWHALVLHFAGVWGSGGVYDLLQQPNDARAALDFALGSQAPRPVRAGKVAVIGYSMGSRAALMSAAADERIGAVVSMAGFCDFTDVTLERAIFQSVTPLLAGASIEALAAQFDALGQTTQPTEAAASIAPRPVLIVHGTADEIVPFFHAGAFMGNHIHQAPIEGARHTFPHHRHVMIEAVEGFLSRWLEGGV